MFRSVDYQSEVHSTYYCLALFHGDYLLQQDILLQVSYTSVKILCSLYYQSNQFKGQVKIPDFLLLFLVICELVLNCDKTIN